MRVKKRAVLAVLVGVIAFGLAIASAASLGGINADQLGADETVVASCDTDGVDIAYATSYDVTAGAYVVDSVTVSAIAAACFGQDVSVTLTDGIAALDNGTVVVPGTSATINLAGTPLASVVTGVAVLIAG
jgi:hypothetical protein